MTLCRLQYLTLILKQSCAKSLNCSFSLFVLVLFLLLSFNIPSINLYCSTCMLWFSLQSWFTLFGDHSRYFITYQSFLTLCLSCTQPFMHCIVWNKCIVLCIIDRKTTTLLRKTLTWWKFLLHVILICPHKTVIHVSIQSYPCILWPIRYVLILNR